MMARRPKPTIGLAYTFFTEAVDGQAPRPVWVAGPLEEMTGFTHEEYLARGGWQAALHPDDLPQDARDLEVLRQNRAISSEVRILCKDASVRWVRLHAQPAWDAGRHRLAGVHGTVQDITEEKNSDSERQELIRELDARGAQLERFTHTVSHDLKGPLITIRGFLGHIKTALIEGRLDAVKADLERVYEAAERMTQLLDDLLRLSSVGRQGQPPEEVSFGVIVREAIDRAHARLTESGAVVEAESDLPTINVDRDRLVEVMQNLLENAAKFMGGQASPRIWIGIRSLPSERAFFVRDNGVGIAPRDRERVFDLFEKLDPRSGGTGIGLALVKRIIEMHGGRVWVESGGLSKGSTFLFTLGRQPSTSVLPRPSSPRTT